MGVHLMAVVAEGERGRTYSAPDHTHRQAAMCDEPAWKPVLPLPPMARSISVQIYGLDEWWKLFTTRQLVMLSTLSDLLKDVAEHVQADALVAGIAIDQLRLRDGGKGATAYADAVVTYLAFAIDRLADLGNSLVPWEPIAQCPRHLFGRQGVPMVWDYAEANPFSSSSGSFMTCLQGTLKGLNSIGEILGTDGRVAQGDASATVAGQHQAVVSTDPPYYDNVTYSEASDFFYVWLRRNLADVWPEECSTLLTPKTQELVANRYQHGSKEAAEHHFRSGMAEFMSQVALHQPSDVPATIYYAYKATETKDGEIRGDPELELVLELRAKNQQGFNESTQRTVSENARNLEAQSSEFE